LIKHVIICSTVVICCCRTTVQFPHWSDTIICRTDGHGPYNVLQSDPVLPVF